MEKSFLEFVAEILDVEVDEISMETKYKEFEKWDSLAMMNLVMELEEEYDVTIPIENVSKVKVLGDLFALVKEDS